jgi:hypothetical protein
MPDCTTSFENKKLLYASYCRNSQEEVKFHQDNNTEPVTSRELRDTLMELEKEYKTKVAAWLTIRNNLKTQKFDIYELL